MNPPEQCKCLSKSPLNPHIWSPWCQWYFHEWEKAKSAFHARFSEQNSWISPNVYDIKFLGSERFIFDAELWSGGKAMRVLSILKLNPNNKTTWPLENNRRSWILTLTIILCNNADVDPIITIWYEGSREKWAKYSLFFVFFRGLNIFIVYPIPNTYLAVCLVFKRWNLLNCDLLFVLGIPCLDHCSVRPFSKKLYRLVSRSNLYSENTLL